MAKGMSRHDDAALQSSDVSDQVVSQVGKAAVEILKLRQSLEENMATAQTEEERETLTSQVEMAAVRAIDEQGLTVEEYNEVLAAARSDQELEERVLLACKAAGVSIRGGYHESVTSSCSHSISPAGCCLAGGSTAGTRDTAVASSTIATGADVGCDGDEGRDCAAARGDDSPGFFAACPGHEIRATAAGPV